LDNEVEKMDSDTGLKTHRHRLENAITLDWFFYI